MREKRAHDISFQMMASRKNSNSGMLGIMRRLLTYLAIQFVKPFYRNTQIDECKHAHRPVIRDPNDDAMLFVSMSKCHGQIGKIQHRVRYKMLRKIQ